MASDRANTIDRLASRAQKPGLQRRQLASGGEVFTGALASRTLDAMGARAMTVDRSIIVSEDFDPNKPEDAALFAHEQVHLEHSGGQGGNSGYDHEERQARAAESMVLHRSHAGGIEMHEASHTSAPGGAPTGSAGAGHERTAAAEAHGNADAGYNALRAQGMSHDEVVQKLAREALLGLESGRDARSMRWGDKKSFT
ncbi:MAG: DUF4157 domain-containing protein [Myxococcales bacterium]|nr:DUF4157 domain-containing protein [Myxococcales bacterium]